MGSLRLKGAAWAWLVQSGLKPICGTLRLSAQLAAMRSAPFGDSAMDQHHVRMLGADLVERVPDQAVIVEVEAAGKGDLGAGGQQHLGVGPALGGEEVAAVDHRRGQVRWLTIDPRAWPPG